MVEWGIICLPRSPSLTPFHLICLIFSRAMAVSRINIVPIEANFTIFSEVTILWHCSTSQQESVSLCHPGVHLLATWRRGKALLCWVPSHMGIPGNYQTKHVVTTRLLMNITFHQMYYWDTSSHHIFFQVFAGFYQVGRHVGLRIHVFKLRKVKPPIRYSVFQTVTNQRRFRSVNV